MKRFVTLCVCVFLFNCTVPLAAQEVGDVVSLRSNNASGVPVHPNDGDTAYVRWPNGTVGEVIGMGRWFQIKTADGSEGWVTATYLTLLDEAPDEEVTTGNEVLAYAIGAWNIEHFKVGATRGFPENTRGGPSYPQSQRDIGFIAGIIRDDLQAAVLALSEINGISNQTRSNEMDNLVTALGTGWEYELSASGSAQRLAILYDTSKARKEVCQEFSIPPKDSQGKDISARDPLGCLFTLISPTGQDMNDLVVIAVHLASGQHHNTNHNEGMAELANRFAGAFDGSPFPSAESDVLIAGDFNANRYDNKVENFWADFGGTVLDMDVLAPDNGEDYPATRLKSVPLFPGSKIDYVMASRNLRGDLVLTTANVRQDLLTTPLENFRRLASDHIPVTVQIRLIQDDD